MSSAPDPNTAAEEEETYLDENEVEQELEMDSGNEPMSEDDGAVGAADSDSDQEGAEDGPDSTTDNSIAFVDDSVQGFFDHREPIYAVALHPTDPAIAATGGGDDRGYLWRIDTGEKLYDLGVHSDSVVAIAFSNDGKYVASGGMDGKVLVFRVDGGHLEQSLEGPTEITWLNWHPKGNVLLAGGEDGTIWMWRIPSGQCMMVFTGHSDSVTCGQFTPDVALYQSIFHNPGKTIVSGSADGTIIIWDPKTSTAVHRLTADDARFHQAAITTLSVNIDSTIMVSAAQDGSVRLLRISNGAILAALDGHQESVEATGFSDMFPYLATGSIDGKINIWDTTTMRLRHTLKHDDAVIKLQWHKSSPFFTSCSSDSTVRSWDGRSGECTKIWRGHQAPILDFSVRSDGNVIVTGSDDGTALVFQT
ncbi:hypothetical protein BSLG_008951 [Batrachochytrium salamandrivorans]|nr:hypothetical protein BSLG_008951 [Batrachochytrium salamandrivorans]